MQVNSRNIADIRKMESKYKYFNFSMLDNILYIDADLELFANSIKINDATNKIYGLIELRDQFRIDFLRLYTNNKTTDEFIAQFGDISDKSKEIIYSIFSQTPLNQLGNYTQLAILNNKYIVGEKDNESTYDYSNGIIYGKVYSKKNLLDISVGSANLSKVKDKQSINIEYKFWFNPIKYIGHVYIKYEFLDISDELRTYLLTKFPNRSLEEFITKYDPILEALADRLESPYRNASGKKTKESTNLSNIFSYKNIISNIKAPLVNALSARQSLPSPNMEHIRMLLKVFGTSSLPVYSESEPAIISYIRNMYTVLTQMRTDDKAEKYTKMPRIRNLARNIVKEQSSFASILTLGAPLDKPFHIEETMRESEEILRTIGPPLSSSSASSVSVADRPLSSSSASSVSVADRPPSSSSISSVSVADRPPSSSSISSVSVAYRPPSSSSISSVSVAGIPSSLGVARINTGQYWYTNGQGPFHLDKDTYIQIEKGQPILYQRTSNSSSGPGSFKRIGLVRLTNPSASTASHHNERNTVDPIVELIQAYDLLYAELALRYKFPIKTTYVSGSGGKSPASGSEPNFKECMELIQATLNEMITARDHITSPPLDSSLESHLREFRNSTSAASTAASTSAASIDIKEYLRRCMYAILNLRMTINCNAFTRIMNLLNDEATSTDIFGILNKTREILARTEDVLKEGTSLKVIFVRHSVSCQNIRKGKTEVSREKDPELSRVGIREALRVGDALGSKIVEEGRNPILGASVLLRAQQTAYLMLYPEVPIHIFPYISESDGWGVVGSVGNDNTPKSREEQRVFYETYMRNIVTKLDYTYRDETPDGDTSSLPKFITFLNKKWNTFQSRGLLLFSHGKYIKNMYTSLKKPTPDVMQCDAHIATFRQFKDGVRLDHITPYFRSGITKESGEQHRDNFTPNICLNAPLPEKSESLYNEVPGEPGEPGYKVVKPGKEETVFFSPIPKNTRLTERQRIDEYNTLMHISLPDINSNSGSDSESNNRSGSSLTPRPERKESNRKRLTQKQRVRRRKTRKYRSY